VGSTVIPPLPEGFELDRPPRSAGGLPPLPPGFRLDTSPDNEPRIPIGVDPRHDLDLAFNEEDTRTAARSAATGLALMGGAAVPGAVGALGNVLKFAADPRVGAAAAGAKTLAETGDLSQAGTAAGTAYFGQKFAGKMLGKAADKVGGWMSKALQARLAHQVARAAKVADSAAPVVAKAADAAVDVEALLKTARAADSTPAARHAARIALKKAGVTTAPVPVAEVVAPVAEVAVPVARVAKPLTMPVKGNVKMATVYTRPKGLPETRSEEARRLQSSGARSLREKQLEAAKAAGVDIGEAFGTAKAAAPVAKEAAESALETRLRASVLMKKDPTALANEIADHVVGLGKLKPERAAEAVQELYGIPAGNAKQMVEMVYRAQGWR
jgi:hypothetical protein